MMKNQGPSGRAVDAGGLDLPVDALFFRRQQVEVPLRGGGQGLDDVFQGVAVEPVPQVEEQHRHLGVREELGKKWRWLRYSLTAKVIGEVAVVHQGGVERREGVGAAGVPDPAPGGIALVGDPDVGLEIQQLVIVMPLPRHSPRSSGS